MEAKEKALELANKMYYVHGKIDSDMAIQCALIAVGEMIEFHGNYCSECQDDQDKKLQYLLEVKQEIEKL